MNVVTWIGRLLFLGVLYYFIVRFLLVLKHNTDRLVEGVPQRSRSAQRPAPQRLVLVGTPGRVENARTSAMLTAGQWLALRSGMTVGRSKGNDIRLEDEFSSGTHAMFFFRDNTWWVEDLGSTNGTFINGSRVADLSGIFAGDEVAIGRTIFRLEE